MFRGTMNLAREYTQSAIDKILKYDKAAANAAALFCVKKQEFNLYF